MAKKWIQKAFTGHTKGTLHHALHIPIHEKIPENILVHISNSPIGHHDTIHGHPITITHLLKKRAQMLLNIEKARK